MVMMNHVIKFLHELSELSKCDRITPSDIQNLVVLNSYSVNSHSLLTFLYRQNMSMTKISKESLKALIRKLTEHKYKYQSKNMTRKKAKSFNQKLSFMKLKTFITVSEMSKEEILQKGQELFFRLADFMLFKAHSSPDKNSKILRENSSNTMSLSDIIHTKVFFKVIDGFEYMLIRLNDLFNLLQANGFEMSDKDKKVMRKFLDETFEGVVKVNSITKYLEELGVQEKLPKSNKFLDYENLDAASIRLFNKIIQQIEKGKV